MFQFIKYNENQTPTEAQMGSELLYSRFSPSIYFGNPTGFKRGSYDPFNERTLKQFKVSVAGITGGSILRLDTLDLYTGHDHTVDENLLDSDQTGVTQACPVKFQRIHFKASQGGGTPKEFFSIFLAGYPVPVNDSLEDYSETGQQLWSPGYAGTVGSYGERIVIGEGNDYNSYFKLVDKTSGTTAKIGVIDGGSTISTGCGAVKINGERVSIPNYESTSFGAVGEYWVWLHSFLSVIGEEAEIIIGPVNDGTPPDNPYGALYFANQILGRVETEQDGPNIKIKNINQDYLRGGEHAEFIFFDCDQEVDITCSP